MDGLLFGSSGEEPMNENKSFADKTAKAARETFEKNSAATQQSARGVQQDFNVRLMEMQL